ncbi:hypothetical protein ATO7_05845 [Oceanococcus atlanticus]|uniref:Ribbon-helix-helix protein CopG domain-containing protein n=1 Tax=Oceanococcus atlanticus TaxID=1317117 RepID=A0A1Y1SIH2_9GAMM|nr:ribbon-helix-helix protein, CopG family [Oceanococcus atlanticus]ORE89378.1 hypothetical protein ATO7_05845 [Oceanococcus atlanticus]RZO84974.1 MAG: ribbon-helix-helix protein, CopG family [Oceanococcus sp.]
MSKKKTDKKKKNTSLRLDETTLKALKMRALETDSSVQAIIEQLVDDYLANRIKLKKKR